MDGNTRVSVDGLGKKGLKKFSVPFRNCSVLSLSRSIRIKLHALAYIAVELRDATSIYTRVEINNEHLTKLSLICHNYFSAYNLFLSPQISCTVWTVGYAIPYHTRQMYDQLKYGLWLNSMQGREAKHIKLAKYVDNTCNVKKSDWWWVVFRHEYISMVWLRELDPLSITYKKKVSRVICTNKG